MTFDVRYGRYGGVAQRTEYDGGRYDSKFEANYAAELDLRLKAKDIKKWERQVVIPLHGKNGGHICDYKVDFKVTHNDGTVEYVETKGLETPVWRIKWKLFEDEYGDRPDEVKLTVVRQKSRWQFGRR